MEFAHPLTASLANPHAFLQACGPARVYQAPRRGEGAGLVRAGDGVGRIARLTVALEAGGAPGPDPRLALDVGAHPFWARVLVGPPVYNAVVFDPTVARAQAEIIVDRRQPAAVERTLGRRVAYPLAVGASLRTGRAVADHAREAMEGATFARSITERGFGDAVGARGGGTLGTEGHPHDRSRQRVVGRIDVVRGRGLGDIVGTVAPPHPPPPGPG